MIFFVAIIVYLLIVVIVSFSITKIPFYVDICKFKYLNINELNND